MTFRPNISVRICRLAFLLIFIVLPLYLATLSNDRSLVKESDVVFYISLCLLFAILGLGLLFKFFWEKFFAKLIITKTHIVWKCLFRKPIVLSIEACDYIGVQQEESHNGIPYYFIYLSNKPYPAKYFGKINKVACKEGFIKFWYSQELSEYLISYMPGSKTGTLLAFRMRLKNKL